MLTTFALSLSQGVLNLTVHRTTSLLGEKAGAWALAPQNLRPGLGHGIYPGDSDVGEITLG